MYKSNGGANMIKETNTRFFVTTSQKLYDKLTAYCDEMGISRSSLVTLLISQYLSSIDTVNGAMQQAIKSMADKEVK
jgi:metal-responsive CopG/Arc/MetJ family transcriptional regulator